MMQTIQSDFDLLAHFDELKWNHNSHYFSFLMNQIPQPCKMALDIGCGTGAFTRLLAARSERVLGIDLSPQMVKIASEKSKEYPNIEYLATDVMSWDSPLVTFDCVVSIAALHHLPMEVFFSKTKTMLKPGGVLLILDLYKAAEILDYGSSLVALPLNLVYTLVKNGRIHKSPGARRAWAEHDKHDHFLRLAEIRNCCARILPGAEIKRHLFWRYSIIWKKDDY